MLDLCVIFSDLSESCFPPEGHLHFCELVYSAEACSGHSNIKKYYKLNFNHFLSSFTFVYPGNVGDINSMLHIQLACVTTLIQKASV